MLGTPLPPVSAGAVEAARDAARLSLGEAGFERFWQEGEHLSLQQAAESAEAVVATLDAVEPSPRWQWRDPAAGLTPREREVLALMAEGLGNTAIAERLFVTEGAVHKNIRGIFAKLDLAPTDRADRRVTAVLRYLDDTARR